MNYHLGFWLRLKPGNLQCPPVGLPVRAQVRRVFRQVLPDELLQLFRPGPVQFTAQLLQGRVYCLPVLRRRSQTA